MSDTNFCRLSAAALTLAIALSTPDRVAGQQDGAALPRSTIHVSLFGCFGEKVPPQTAQIHLFTADRKRDIAPPGHNLVITGVPFGTYVLAAWDSGGSFGEREVAVNAQEVWVRLGLSFPAGDTAWPAGGLSITGDVRPVPSGGDWWVRAEGVFLDFTREAPILLTGHFSLEGLKMGTYLVEVFDGSKLRHVETVEIDTRRPNTELQIAIAARADVR